MFWAVRNASLTSVLKFWYLPVANGGLAAVPTGAINGDLRLILVRRGPHYHKSLKAASWIKW